MMAKRKPKTKKCPKCGRRKRVGEFYRNKRSKDGLSHWCGTCHRRASNEWRRSQAASDPIGHWIHAWVHCSKSNAKKRGLDHDLTREDIVELYEQSEGRCAVTGIEVTFQSGDGRCHTNASIDRIDNNRGYVPGNIRLVCDRVNMMRSNMSDTEFVWWCQQVVDNCTTDMESISETYEPIEPLGDIDLHSDS